MQSITENFEPIVVDNCFDQEHILSAYRTMTMAPHILNTKTNQRDLVQPDKEFGYTSYNQHPDKIVLKRILDICKKNTDLNLNNPDFHFAKYAKSSGYRPQLYPHYDVNLKVPHLTFSIQIESTFPWAMYIDGKEYILKNNQGLLFSGTHQIHWRKNINFGEYDYCDVLLSQFSLKNGKEMDDNHYLHMEEKRKSFISLW